MKASQQSTTLTAPSPLMQPVASIMASTPYRRTATACPARTTLIVSFSVATDPPSPSIGMCLAFGSLEDDGRRVDVPLCPPTLPAGLLVTRDLHRSYHLIERRRLVGVEADPAAHPLAPEVEIEVAQSLQPERDYLGYEGWRQGHRGCKVVGSANATGTASGVGAAVDRATCSRSGVGGGGHISLIRNILGKNLRSSYLHYMSMPGVLGWLSYDPYVDSPENYLDSCSLPVIVNGPPIIVL